MSDHTKALVPLESWAYASPELLISGQKIDIGLFAEALIYYETVIVNAGNQNHFAAFLDWFTRQNRFADLIELIRDGSIKFYDYAFLTTVIEKEGTHSLWNIQDQMQQAPNTFEKRFLYHSAVESKLPTKARHRKKFYEAMRGNVIEVKAEEFGPSLENARMDHDDPHRNAHIAQMFVNEIYRIKQIRNPPKVEATVRWSPDGKKNISWNLDLNLIGAVAGPQLNFRPAVTLTAGAHSNRFIWSASELGCDLFLPRPMGALVGDKLFEVTQRIEKSHEVVEILKEKVEFPDVRHLVNSGKLGLADVLELRKKGRKFRDWLQCESDRDRDALIAYHNEVTKDSALVSTARKALSIFGLLGGSAGGAAIGGAIGGPVGSAVGVVAGTSVKYLTDMASKTGSNWKPVVFGEWMRIHIENVIQKQKN